MDTTTRLDTKSCECPLNSDSLMSRVTFLQESLVFTDTITSTRKQAQQCCLSACKHIICTFPGCFSVPHTETSAVFASCGLLIRSQSILRFNRCFASFVFSPHLSPLFVFHIHWLHLLFPLLSMHEVNGTGEPADP